jgi:hypothetical protein
MDGATDDLLLLLLIPLSILIGVGLFCAWALASFKLWRRENGQPAASRQTE